MVHPYTYYIINITDKADKEKYSKYQMLPKVVGFF